MNAEPSNKANAKLSQGDASELAAGVAELTRAGLPLPEGLRALAQELPGWRVRRVLRNMAADLERGISIEDAMNSASKSLPPYLHGLILAGIRTGRLPEVMEEYIQMEESQRRIRQRLRLSLAYPILLAIILTLMVFGYQNCLLASFEKMFKDFQTALPTLTLVMFASFKYVQGIMVLLVVCLIAIPLLLSDAPGLGWLSPLIYRIPILGTLLKYSRWAMFSRLTAMLLEQKTPLPRALELIAAGLNDPYMARACRSTASQVEGGRSLSQAMMFCRWFPQSMIPFIQWGEQANALPEAFSSANRIFEGRANSQTMSLMSIFLPIALFIIIIFVGLTVIAVFMPLISLITSLTGGGH